LDVDDYHQIETKIKGNDFVGEAYCKLGEVIGAKGASKIIELKNEKHSGRHNGSITVKVAEVGNTSLSVAIRLSANHLDKKDFLGKSDPFVVISRGDASGGFTAVHKTEVIKNTLDPTWNEFQIPFGRLAGNNPNTTLSFECWDWDSDGSNDLIGSFKTTYAQLLTTKTFDLINESKKSKTKKYINSGVLNILSIREIRIPSFLDYVTSGTEVSLIVGVDYTASNGDPRTPTSLHFFNPNGPNEYMQAIRVVGDVVAPYDYDGLIPAYGFGAKFNGEVNHCFHITANENPNCVGVTGVLYAYQSSFSWLQLYGPTNFAPIIRNITAMAKQGSPLGSKYQILLMITDGEITDMSETIQAIKQAASAPLSIIIVGVGNADFTSMNQLDDDDGKLFPRDLVQFVPFRNYKTRPIADLAKDTLAEVPKQLVQFMTANNVLPRGFQK